MASVKEEVGIGHRLGRCRTSQGSRFLFQNLTRSQQDPHLNSPQPSAVRDLGRKDS